MWQLALIPQRLLHQHPRKISSHKSIEVGITLPRFKIRSMQQSKRYNNLKQTLLIMYLVRHTVECCYAFEQHTRRCFLEVFIR
jgi:hypothetical protein